MTRKKGTSAAKETGGLPPPVPKKLFCEYSYRECTMKSVAGLCEGQGKCMLGRTLKRKGGS